MASGKQKKKPKDPEQLWNERQGNKAAASKVDKLIQDGQKGEIISRAAEEDITNELFQPELGTEASSLKSKQNYIKFAQ